MPSLQCRAVGNPDEELDFVGGPSAAAPISLVTHHGAAGAAKRMAELPGWGGLLRLWVVTLAAPAAVILAAVGLSTILGAHVGGWQDPGRLYLVVPVFLFVLVLGGPIGEELGWRGYALAPSPGEARAPQGNRRARRGVGSVACPSVRDRWNRATVGPAIGVRHSDPGDGRDLHLVVEQIPQPPDHGYDAIGSLEQ